MPTGVYPRPPATTRFMRYVDQTEGCWPWRGIANHGGYGEFRLEGVRRTAHRAAYLLFVGAIAEGLQVDHLCRNRICVRPDHLELVTPSENLRRAVPFWSSRRVAQCRRGHPRTPENTYVHADGKRTHCRACALEATRRWRERRAA